MIDADAVMQEVLLAKKSKASSCIIPKMQQRIKDVLGDSILLLDKEIYDPTKSEEALEKLSNLFTPELVNQFLTAELKRFITEYEDGCTGGGGDGYYRFILYTGTNFTITVNCINALDHSIARSKRKNFSLPDKIVIDANDSLYKFLSGEADISIWKSSNSEYENKLDKESTCILVKTSTVTRGSQLYLKGGVHGLTFSEIRKPITTLTIISHYNRRSVSEEYDSESLRLKAICAADAKSSRVQLLATLLRELEAPSAFETIAEFLAHRDYFVRWHAMKELISCDPMRALHFLDNMINSETHPQVLKAAHAAKTIINKEINNAT